MPKRKTPERKLDIRECPQCGIHAIVVPEGTKPKQWVVCNNCHFRFILKDL